MKTNDEIICELAELVQNMVNESGNPEGFDSMAWITNWIDKPIRALGGKRPRSYLNNIEGQERIKYLLKSIQSGAYR